MTDIKFIEEYTNNDKAITDDKLEYLQCNSKLKGYVGERQSGKTFLLYQDLVCNAFNIKGDYLVIAPNYPELKLVQDYINNVVGAKEGTDEPQKTEEPKKKSKKSKENKK